jgi:hypothetical protein
MAILRFKRLNNVLCSSAVLIVNAGVAAGASYSMGEIVASAPSGCARPTVSGVTYFLCGNTWLQPAYGANGVYYRVVPAP